MVEIAEGNDAGMMALSLDTIVTKTRPSMITGFNGPAQICAATSPGR